MKSATMQAAAFIRNGPRPMAMACLAILQSSWNSGLPKCRNLFLSERKRIV